MQATPSSSTAAGFSPRATGQLASALAAYAASGNAESVTNLRQALGAMSADARAVHAGAQRMLTAVKAVWSTLPEVAAMESRQATMAFERVLGASLDAYYGIASWSA